ncbi:hypothetical protein TNCV_740171 [Trichonephila clavipes]|nr:hypothetical protein TNCV_740171 [Trichonephila clavipes]
MSNDYYTIGISKKLYSLSENGTPIVNAGVTSSPFQRQIEKETSKSIILFHTISDFDDLCEVTRKLYTGNSSDKSCRNKQSKFFLECPAPGMP